ncbi:hypothetical protein [Nocardia thailandica]
MPNPLDDPAGDPDSGENTATPPVSGRRRPPPAYLTGRAPEPPPREYPAPGSAADDAEPRPAPLPRKPSGGADRPGPRPPEPPPRDYPISAERPAAGARPLGSIFDVTPDEVEELSRPAPASVGGARADQPPGHYAPPDIGDDDPRASRSRTLAVVALVAGVLAVLAGVTVLGGLVFGLAAVIVGVVAVLRIRRGRAAGTILAWSGLVLGILGIAVAGWSAWQLWTDIGGRDYLDCVDRAAGNSVAEQRCKDVFSTSIERKMGRDPASTVPTVPTVPAVPPVPTR